MTDRDFSYHQFDKPSILDKFGVYLSKLKLSKAFRMMKDDVDSLLDVGSGFHASVTRPFWDNSTEIYLMDYSVDGSISALPNVHYYQGDSLSFLPTMDSSKISLICVNNVLEHIDQDELFLCHIFRVSKFGGVTYINVPNWFGKIFLEFSAFKLNLSPKSEMNDHKRYYSKSELWTIVRNAGWKPENIKIKSTNFGMNTTAYLVK